MLKPRPFENIGKGEERRCIGLYTALSIFTSQFLTRSGRKNLRKFVNSSKLDIHDPQMLARYVLAPVNTVVTPQQKLLRHQDAISEEVQIWLKLFWNARHVLIDHMLYILTEYGLEPDCKYKTATKKSFVDWVVDESPYGKKEKHGIKGVTQVIFMEYARRTGCQNLFSTLCDNPGKHQLTGKALFKEDSDRDKFVGDWYGLGKDNNLKAIFGDIITGKIDIDHLTLSRECDAVQKGKISKASKAKRSPKKDTGNGGVIADPEAFTKRVPEQNKGDDGEDGKPAAKQSTKCQHCLGLTTVVQALHLNMADVESGTPLSTIINALKTNIPGLENLDDTSGNDSSD
jgi:hypothetical protein